MKEYTCQYCECAYKTLRHDSKFCSLKCKNAAHSTQVEFELIRELYELELTQKELSELLGIGRRVIEKLFKKNKYKGRVAKARPHLRGLYRKKKNLSYNGYHARVHKAFGKADHCSVCGEDSPDIKYEWANISGDYADIYDYSPMCRSCHKSYDNIIENITGTKIKIKN